MTAALAPRYRTLFTLARGGMGRIDVAQRRDAGFERLVAIKRLHESFAHDEELIAMLLDEARVAGTIRHANVVSVLDVGRDDEGPFLVMDLVEGLSLQQLLRGIAEEGLLPLQVALRILRQLAAGLHAAHESRDARGEALGVVHRDVSPQNVLIGADGVARLTDFGIAKAFGASTATAAGIVKGKLRYMAPEQLTFGAIDRRTDLYALGVVAIELISGRHPHPGRGEDVARATIAGEVPDLGDDCPEIPAALVELVFRLLAHDAELRPADAAEVGRTLDAILAELALEEGPMEVEDFVQPYVAPARDALRERIRRTLEAPEPTKPAIPVDVDALEPLPTRLEGRRVRRGRFAWLAAGAALVVLGLLLPALWNLRAPVEDTTMEPPTATAPAEAPHRTAEVAPDEPSDAPDAPPVAEEPPKPARPAATQRRRPPLAPRRTAWSWEHESR